MKKMYGVVPPMITPFTESGELDVPALKTLVQFLRERVHGLFVTGSYGSGPMMSTEERKTVTEVSVKEANGKVPIVTMVGAVSTREAVELSRHAESVGATSVAAVGPFYFTHDQGRLLRHFSEIVKSVKVPVYIYNNPQFQGYKISFETIEKLKAEGVAGVKDATFDILEHAAYHRRLRDENFDVVLGTESMWLSARVLGCEAFIPGLANAFPEIVTKMFDEGMADDFAACRETQFKVNQLRDIMYLARSTQLAVYAMLSIRGVIDSYPRLPFSPATDAEKQAVERALKNMGMI
jgi:dihydrodipicolinate synthase/N-acetylneuraminate lyase